MAGQLAETEAGMEGESCGCFGGEVGTFCQRTQPFWVTSISGLSKRIKQRAGRGRWVEELEGQVEDHHPGRAGDNTCHIGCHKSEKRSA